MLGLGTACSANSVFSFVPLAGVTNHLLNALTHRTTDALGALHTGHSIVCLAPSPSASACKATRGAYAHAELPACMTTALLLRRSSWVTQGCGRSMDAQKVGLGKDKALPLPYDGQEDVSYYTTSSWWSKVGLVPLRDPVARPSCKT